MFDQRLGRFTISLDLLRREPKAVQKVMGECIPVRAECLYHADCIEYMAISKHFRKVPPGKLVPEYHVTLQDRQSGLHLKFKEKE